jgi:5-methylcytosine-specific restriction endonuclease McrA
VKTSLKKIKSGLRLILNYRREYRRKRAQANPEHRRKYRRKWGQANSRYCERINAKRRAAKKNALTPWANVNAIKNFYTEARRLTKLTGVKHHVDHIYPLQSEYMCGLHVETNLQILTEKENVAKGNRTWPGQLECQKGSVYARFPKELTDLLND